MAIDHAEKGEPDERKITKPPRGEERGEGGCRRPGQQEAGHARPSGAAISAASRQRHAYGPR